MEGEFVHDARRGKHDLIAVDAYSMDAVPAKFLTLEFLRAAARRIRPGGVFVTQLWNGETCLDDFATTLAEAWGAAHCGGGRRRGKKAGAGAGEKAGRGAGVEAGAGAGAGGAAGSGGGVFVYSLELLDSTVFFAQRVAASHCPGNGHGNEGGKENDHAAPPPRWPSAAVLQSVQAIDALREAATNGSVPRAGLLSVLDEKAMPGTEVLLTFTDFQPVLRSLWPVRPVRGVG